MPSTYDELKENETHEGSPQKADAPHRELDVYVRLVFLRAGLLPALLGGPGGLKASSSEVVDHCRHAGLDRKRATVKYVFGLMSEDVLKSYDSSKKENYYGRSKKRSCGCSHKARQQSKDSAQPPPTIT